MIAELTPVDDASNKLTTFYVKLSPFNQFIANEIICFQKQPAVLEVNLISGKHHLLQVRCKHQSMDKPVRLFHYFWDGLNYLIENGNY